ncbi:hypothetical protein SFHH103_02122 [Sinorhizobium fredii HH103]|uniref:Uncharacterized protein n=1 Tax=Sinorhizobium fredii (strain HH103) TaxID=1117943 RepID=G9A8N7_SINF1|nr:hypothetical protein SFHH103_02122 [Sinorhizobium fredii HH103]
MAMVMTVCGNTVVPNGGTRLRAAPVTKKLYRGNHPD